MDIFIFYDAHKLRECLLNLHEHDIRTEDMEYNGYTQKLIFRNYAFYYSRGNYRIKLHYVDPNYRDVQESTLLATVSMDIFYAAANQLLHEVTKCDLACQLNG